MLVTVRLVSLTVRTRVIGSNLGIGDQLYEVMRLYPSKDPHNTRCTNSAFNIREALKDYLNGAGAVPWQLGHVRRTGEDSEDSALEH